VVDITKAPIIAGLVIELVFWLLWKQKDGDMEEREKSDCMSIGGTVGGTEIGEEGTG